MTPTKPTADDLVRDAVKDMAVCDAATPGPWSFNVRLTADDPGHWCIPIRTADPCRLAAHCYGTDHRLPNATFVAASRDALPAWIARARYAEHLLRLIYTMSLGSSAWTLVRDHLEALELENRS